MRACRDLNRHWSCRIIMNNRRGFTGIMSMPAAGSPSREVFCNRELALKSIRAVGFDMDYTLAQYNPEFATLAYLGAWKKLVAERGYPEEILELPYDHEAFCRGLVIDKDRGNIIKADRYQYVRVAFHGNSPLSTEARRACYREGVDRAPDFNGADYVNVDTHFQVVDAAMFSQLVEFKDRTGLLRDKTYRDLFNDIRIAVDLCHRDGTIKDEVARDPERYIVRDPELFNMLAQMRKGGKKLFLLTNSLFDFTDVVMGHLAEGKAEWMEAFDVVMCGACKPAFLTEDNLSLFRVNPKDGTLTNTEGIVLAAEEFLSEGKVFQGGSYHHLHSLLELQAGEELLYVGDHIYSDIVRSKRTLGWRTCFILPELETEMDIIRRTLNQEYMKIQRLRLAQHEHDSVVDRLSIRLCQSLTSEQRQGVKKELERELQRQDELKEQLDDATRNYHHLFHGQWGQIFKAGVMDSRFAKQILDYACIYTTRASALGSISPTRTLRAAAGDLMPHDRSLPHYPPLQP